MVNQIKRAMKELSIEEKAKAYNKALEKARQLCAYPTTKPFISDLQDLFPELKESEDERIRKALLGYIKGVSEREVCKETLNEWIAWLEKQGEKILVNSAKTCKDEQKPAWSEENDDDAWLNDIISKAECNLQLNKGEIDFLKSLKDRVQSQSQQEWSEKDEEIYNLLYEEYKNLAYHSHSRNQERDIPGEILGWLKSIKDRVQPQPKQEWSEEDEDMIQALNACINTVIKSGMNYISFDSKSILIEKVKNWLKFLKDRVQSQNKWKESLATVDLENSLCDMQDGFSDTSYEYRILGEAIEFIRCTEPKPQWKPSDEQMDALNDVISSRNIKYDVLSELWEDLKKLKG